MDILSSSFQMRRYFLGGSAYACLALIHMKEMNLYQHLFI